MGSVDLLEKHLIRVWRRVRCRLQSHTFHKGHQAHVCSQPSRWITDYTSLLLKEHPYVLTTSLFPLVLSMSSRTSVPPTYFTVLFVTVYLPVKWELEFEI